MFDIDDNGREEPVYYNGYRAGVHVRNPDANGGGNGAVELGIDRLAAVGVQGRGVMVDLQRAFGSERVAVGYEQLMEVMSNQKVSVEEGDFLCLHTGFSELVLSMNRSPDAEILARSCAVLDGRDDRLLDWISQSGIAAICADNFAVERYPNPPGPSDRYSILPLHNHCLFRIGVHLGELWYLTELQKWLREHDRSTFLLTAPPLRLPGAVGSPVTPIATV
jgi:kynurenine formamidase